MKELGYGCTVNASQCKEILSLFLPLSEVTLSKILGTIACTQAGLEDNQNTFSTFSLAVGCSTLSDLPLLNSWNIDVLIDTIKELVSLLVLLLAAILQFFLYCNNCFAIVSFVSKYVCWIQAPATNWIRVIENMDHEGFYIPNHEAFSFFMSVYRRACQVYFYYMCKSTCTLNIY